MGLGAIGAAIGEGYTAAQANVAVSRDPKNSGEIFKNMLVGQAVAESASIFALVIAILLLFLDVPTPTLLKAAVLFGAGISMGFGAIGSGVGSGYLGGKACTGIARQPAIASQLTTNMLIGSAVCQTPAIFSMVVALMLMFINFLMPLFFRPGLLILVPASVWVWLPSVQDMAVVWQPGQAARELPDNPERQQT